MKTVPTCAPNYLILQNKTSILELKELIDRLHDTFIASKTSTTQLGFQFRKQVEVRGAKSGEYVGWERISKPQAVAAAVATWDV
jgi:hypothetical protein